MVTTNVGSVEDRPGTALDRATAAALLPDGRIVVAGFTHGARPGFAIVRYLSDGRLDPGFGTGGRVHVPADDPHVYGIALQPDGQVLLAGSAGSPGKATSPFSVLRLRADGTSDQTFGIGGLATTTFEGSQSGARALAVQADGKLLTGGAKFGAPGAQADPLSDSGFVLARYNADGSVDRAFGSGGKTVTNVGNAGALPLAIAVQPDGKIVAAGLVFFGAALSPGPFAAFETMFQHINLPTAAVALWLIGLEIGVLRRRDKRSFGF